MANPFVKIFIGSQADTTGARQMEDALRRADSAADEFINSLKLGAGIDLGGRIVGALASVPSLFQDALRRGVEFNTSLADTRVAVANVVKQFGNLSDEAAKGEAARAIAKIIEVEPKAAGSLRDLSGGLLATVASAQAAGITIEQNVDLVGRFANALANANIPAEQLSQELRAIFTGNITPDASLAKILNLTSEDIAKAKQAGTLYEFLTTKVGALGEAGDTFGVKWSSLSSAIDKALGALAEGTTAELARLAEILAEELVKPETIDNLRAFGVDIAHLVGDLGALLEILIQNSGWITLATRGAISLGAAFALIKLRDLAVGLTLKATALVRSTAAIQAETAAIAANTVAQTANNAAGAANARGLGGKTGGATGKLLGAASVLSTVAIVGTVGGEALSSYLDGKGEQRISEANAGSQESQARLAAMERIVALANDETKKIDAKAQLNKAILATQERYITATGQTRANAEAELLAYQSILKNFDARAGIMQAQVNKMSEAERKLLAAAQQELGIIELRAAGFDQAADSAERELAVRQAIAELQKQMPSLETNDARRLAEQKLNGEDAIKAAAAAKALTESMETPPERLARLQADFSRASGNAAPGEFASAADYQAAAGGNARALEIAKEIVDAWRAVSEEKARIASVELEQFNADVERAVKYQAAKLELEEEVQIQRALLTKDKDRVRELERARDIRAETKRLQEQGYGQEEAKKAAPGVVDAKLAVTDQAKADAMREERAKIDVERAKNTKSKRDDVAAEDRLFRIQKQKELEEKGFTRSEASSLTNSLAEDRDRQRRRDQGIIGGTARRSERDTLGGGVDNLAALRRPLGESIAQSPSAKAATAVAGKTDNGTTALHEASEAGKGAVAAVQEAAGSLRETFDSLRDAMQQLKTLQDEVKGLLAREK